MPAVGDILRRFRGLGVPGAPAQAGVPIDRTAAITAELTPVFLALEATEQGARAILDDARHHVGAIESRTADECDSILRRAREEAAATRAGAVAEGTRAIERRCDALVAEAHAQARHIEAVAAGRVEALAEEIVRRVVVWGSR